MAYKESANPCPCPTTLGQSHGLGLILSYYFSPLFTRFQAEKSGGGGGGSGDDDGGGREIGSGQSVEEVV